MSKTPEEMAEEYIAHNRSYPYDPLNAQDRYMKNSYLVGFKTAKDDTARDFDDLMKDLSKRLEESCLPAMDAMEGQYLYQIKQLEAAHPQWISVKDRLPEVGQDVLVWYDGSYGVAYLQKAKPIKLQPPQFNNVERFEWCFNDFEDVGVTHWQPLPAPPKEEE